MYTLSTNTILVLLIIFGKTMANSFNLTPIYNSSGIYFHTINNLRIYNSHWRLLTYINITNYNEKYNKIGNMIKDFEESCDMSKSLEINSLQQLCSQYNHQAYNFLLEISSNKEHVMRIIDRPKNNYRTKRGLINIVGRVSNVLFGVCDDTDAEYFYSKIRDLEISNSRVSQIADAQIQIMQSIISNVNSSLLEINKNQINLADKYNYLLHEMQAEKIALGILNFKTALEERISLLNIILMQYAFETENLVNIINMALQGLVHSSILDTNTLKNQIKNVKTQLPIGEGIPIDLDNSGISELLRLITTNIVYVENVLIFIIEIPLINNYEFILYKNIPLPINIHDNNYVIIAPTSDYIAIDKSRIYYLELSEVQISKCKQISNMLICPYDQQLHYLDKSCELTIFRKPGVLPDLCNLKNVNFNFSIWHRLENTNSWIYVTIKDNIIIKCKNSSETVVLSINGTGILDLDNQCEANTDDGTLLIAKKKITTKMYKDFIPQLDMLIDWKTQLNIADITLNNASILNKGNSIVKNNLFKLTEYSKSLEELKHIKTKNNIMDTINFQLYLIITVIIISIGLVITIILYLIIKNKQCKTFNSVNNPIENKIYDTVNTPNHENPLPRII